MILARASLPNAAVRRSRAARLHALLGVALLASCVSSRPPYVDFPAPSEHDGVRLVVDSITPSRSYRAWGGLAGSLTNVSGRPVARCYVRFEVLDDRGAHAAYATVDSPPLALGETHAFEAPFSSGDHSRPATVRVLQVDVEHAQR